jgi:prophage regulatory protein
MGGHFMSNRARPHVQRSGVDRRRDKSDAPIAFIRLPDVIKLSGLSRSSIYGAIRDNKFPRPIKLNHGRASAWIYGEVVQWMSLCVQQTREGTR